jgi:hypothetical protein
MSDTYAGTGEYHATITTITDDDEPSGSTFSTPLEQLQDSISAMKLAEVTVYAYTVAGDYTWSRPDTARLVEVIVIGHGGDGGAGAGGAGAGGGGGGSGDVKHRSFIIDGNSYTGINMTSADIHIPAVGSNQVCSFISSSPGVYVAAAPGADGAAHAAGVGGAGGAAGGSGGAAGGAGGNTGAGGSAGGDGYSRPGAVAVSAGTPGIGGGGYGAGGGGGAGTGAGGGGAGGFAGPLGAAGNNGSGGTGGAGGPAACFVIVYHRIPEAA